MSQLTSAQPGEARVRRSVPMLHVSDVERSLAFYALLGFVPRGRVPGGAGRTRWADAASDFAELMFAQADTDPIAEQQAVLLYMYSSDVAALRRHLLACGLHEGGPFCGAPGPNDGRRVVFEITRPFYMPDGEIRIHDPDGYVILVGQTSPRPD